MPLESTVSLWVGSRAPKGVRRACERSWGLLRGIRMNKDLIDKHLTCQIGREKAVRDKSWEDFNKASTEMTAIEYEMTDKEHN